MSSDARPDTMPLGAFAPLSARAFLSLALLVAFASRAAPAVMLRLRGSLGAGALDRLESGLYASKGFGSAASFVRMSLERPSPERSCEDR